MEHQWSSSVVEHVSICAGRMFFQILVVFGATNHAELVTSGEHLGWCCPTPCKQRTPTTGPGLHSGGLLSGTRR